MNWPEWITWDRVLAWLVGLGGFAAFIAKEHIKRWMDHRWEQKKQQENAKIVADKALFIRFLKELPYNGSIGFIDNRNMAGWSFPRDQLSQLDDFLHHWKGPENEFLDAALEAKREALHDLIEQYLGYVYTNTFSSDDNLDMSSVPDEWEETQPERFKKVVATLHDLAGDVVKAHRELVSLGKTKLKC